MSGKSALIPLHRVIPGDPGVGSLGGATHQTHIPAATEAGLRTRLIGTLVHESFALGSLDRDGHISYVLGQAWRRGLNADDNSDRGGPRRRGRWWRRGR